MEKQEEQNTKDKSYLIQHLRDRTDKRKLNTIIMVVGEPGMGKSYTSLSFAKRKDPTFNVRTSLIVKPSDFTAKVRATRVLMNEGKPIIDKVWVWDEIGVGMNSKKWNSILNKSVNLVVQTFRNQCITLILNCPNLAFADSDLRRLLNFLFVMKKIDRRHNKAYFKPFQTKMVSIKDKEKMFKMYLRIPNTNSTITQFKCKIPDQDTIDFYEKMKGEFQDVLFTSVDNEVKRMDMLGKAKPIKEWIEIYNEHKKGTTQEEIAKNHNMYQVKVHRIIQYCLDYFSDNKE